ncbi:carbohydrate ABC transporter permease [Ruminococcus sp.]|uniref:carbohydrate ABC transporter permease n=1 Tax=Ruminococcus sp. TaxID=41978 RepID=UPI0025E5C345|nr:carbohydrate ABC transporter permease [Ruminococcus sp.]MBO4524270.1 carbohydrate ABC transporter permease [Ruminococcus sp.]
MRRLFGLRNRRRFVNGCVLLFILFAALMFLVPTVLTIANSFMTSNEISANYGAMFSNMTEKKKVFISNNVNLKFIPDKVTFDQYKAVLIQNSDYLMKFWNSVILTVPITVFQILVAILASYGFSRYPNKFKSIIFFAYIILMIMPYQVTLVPNFLVADKLNMLDTRKAIILPAIFSPFSIFLLTKVMKRIPISYVEAAKLDGASELKILTKIYMPLCKGAIVSIAMLVFIDYWNMVEQPIVLMKNNTLHPLSVFLSEINTGDIGLAFAVGTVYMIPTVLMFLYGEDYLIEGITYSGGIKG